MNFIANLFNKVFGALVAKIANEPVFVSGLAVIALTTFQSSVEGGLGAEDAVLAAVNAVITLLARQLVWPAVKIDAATQTPKPEPEPLEPPAF